MIIPGQIWKNGTKLAQIHETDDSVLQAVVFNIVDENKLRFHDVISHPKEEILLNNGYNLSKDVIVAK